LLGVWPVRAKRLRWGLPLVLAMGWMHNFGIFGAPLLDAAEPARALDGLFFGLRRLIGPRLMLTHVPTKGPFAEVLAGWLDRNHLRQARFWAHERAFLDLSGRDAAARPAYLGHASARRAPSPPRRSAIPPICRPPSTTTSPSRPPAGRAGAEPPSRTIPHRPR
jgi:hypothetical protein